ncbi:PhzF family phenazine biosynthesis protein [Streptomyces boncukensis]|uniref:PhzF family phenazine biosynthesis protein n=1 Tax=Streptomyces boncukensis TaxID=2711219 RepID=A0A6G4WV64_9ACTN|nr:PhzF family phenazine biosynthesis isomerase [Streptomyces boncukensis]NGO69179.1 PhzF family phenazine biosynthesis protein [Streptomyces boncukensis]
MTTNTAPPNTVLRYTAFSATPEGGNPAGVVLDARGLTDEDQLRIAAEVGYSETAFLTPGDTERTFTVRYFSPEAEVDFCGHATIAAAVALGDRIGPGELLLHSPVGEIPVTVETAADGSPYATLSSVATRSEPVAEDELTEALAALGWAADELDPAIPPRIAFAGNRHLVVAAATRARLADLDYDFERLKTQMLRLGLTTVQLVWRESASVFHVRDPFPVGGVVEDPATGAAAAAFAGYAREAGLVPAEARLTLHQGADMGRPGVLTVELRPDDSRTHVSGTATRIP